MGEPADYSWVSVCVSFGEWRWRSGTTYVTELRNAEIRHSPQCNGNCEATRELERTRAEGRLVGKPRHRIRAATNG